MLFNLFQNKNLSLTLLSIPILFLCLTIWSCSNADYNETVKQAYAMRMEGKADSTLILLENVIAEDSTVAPVWFEYARTQMHIGLGDPRKLFDNLDDIQTSISKAIKNEPDNVIYAYFDSYFKFFRAYIALMGNQPDVLNRVGEVIASFESVLALKPDYLEAKLFLVETLSLPVELGGDPVRAESYVIQLEKEDPFLGAQARELILPDEADRVEYWQTLVEEHPDQVDYLAQLGKTFFHQDNTEKGLEYMEKAIQADPSRSLLILDIGRYYMMTAMMDETRLEASLPLAEEALNRFLATKPSAYMKAFTLELLAKIKWASGDNDMATSLREQAAAIDPYYSKAMGIPPELLFNAPYEISHYHSYFFRPF
ncbi:hypothetical protein JW877_03170 [bacterium]|nr:hypothetical protein [bacterium]